MTSIELSFLENTKTQNTFIAHFLKDKPCSSKHFEFLHTGRKKTESRHRLRHKRNVPEAKGATRLEATSSHEDFGNSTIYKIYIHDAL